MSASSRGRAAARFARIFAMLRSLALAVVSCFSALLFLEESTGQNPAASKIDKLVHKAYREIVKGDETGQAKGFESQFDMVPIPGGTFLMGSPAGEKSRNADEASRHPAPLLDGQDRSDLG